jgi:type IV pilus assembly protein PilV
MPAKTFLLPLARSRQGGFTMIEVLVTMLIISLALLGTSGMQAYSMRLNHGAQFRTQAVFLAADLAERMEANRATAVAGGYDIPAPSADTDCAAVYCTGDSLADSDLFKWRAAVAAALPQGQAAPPVRTVAGNPSTYTITISWVDRMENTNNAAYDSTQKLGADANSKGERFFYTATRVIYN